MFNQIDPHQIVRTKHARRVYSSVYRYNPRVRLVDIGAEIKESQARRRTGNLTVRVHLREKPRGARLEAMFDARPDLYIDQYLIPGVKADLIEADYSLQRIAFFAPSVARAATFDPLIGGISVSSEWLYGYGTLGAIVRDRVTHLTMILSNWHVLAGSAYARRGLRTFQPGWGDGGYYRATIGTLERHAMMDGLDAALAVLSNVRNWENDQFEVGPLNGIQSPLLGMRVVKSGRGSRITRGIIDGIAGDFPIRYAGIPRYIRHVIRIVPQDSSFEVSAPGDSGSIWINEDTGAAVALHFAGYNDPETALAMALPQVMDALKVDLA